LFIDLNSNYNSLTYYFYLNVITSVKPRLFSLKENP
jgi:hypothetical protein